MCFLTFKGKARHLLKFLENANAMRPADVVLNNGGSPYAHDFLSGYTFEGPVYVVSAGRVDFRPLAKV